MSNADALDNANDDDHKVDITQQNYVDRIEIATQKIRDVVKGNLFHPIRDVELLSYEDVIIQFEAINSFAVHKEGGEKIVTTVPPGVKKVKSQAELDTIADKEIKKLTATTETLEALKSEILEREDKGFFWDKQRMPLMLNPLQYLREEPCQQCRGSRHIECIDCKGKGYIQCNVCHGQIGQSCNLCHGKGEKQCIRCQTKGKRECHKCRAVGTLNHLTSLKLSADSAFSYDKANLPEVSLPILERLREKLVTKEHATITVQDDIKAKKKDVAEKILTLTYDVKFPLGDAVFRVGEEEVPALVFGYKAALLDVPPFLERYMLTPFNLLREAALGQGNVGHKIREAAFQTRLTNQAVMGVATQGASKTEKLLKHDYSIALEPQFIHNLVKASRGALNKLTIKPQMIGLIIGVIPAFILTLLYIFPFDSGGVETKQALRLLMDIVFIGVCAFLPYFGAQLMARQSMIYALGEGIKNKIRLPKLGIQGIWGPWVAILIFLLFSERAHQHNPDTAPQLYALARGIIG